MGKFDLGKYRMYQFSHIHTYIYIYVCVCMCVYPQFKSSNVDVQQAMCCFVDGSNLY